MKGKREAKHTSRTMIWFVEIESLSRRAKREGEGERGGRERVEEGRVKRVFGRLFTRGQELVRCSVGKDATASASYGRTHCSTDNDITLRHC